MLDKEAANPVSIPLGSQPELDQERRGEISFHNADRCFQRWLSCATCHADARAATMREVLVNHNSDDDHGAVSSLKPVEIDDLIQYPLSL